LSPGNPLYSHKIERPFLRNRRGFGKKIIWSLFTNSWRHLSDSYTFWDLSCFSHSAWLFVLCFGDSNNTSCARPDKTFFCALSWCIHVSSVVCNSCTISDQLSMFNVSSDTESIPRCRQGFDLLSITEALI